MVGILTPMLTPLLTPGRPAGLPERDGPVHVPEPGARGHYGGHPAGPGCGQARLHGRPHLQNAVPTCSSQVCSFSGAVLAWFRFKVSECPWVGDCQPPRAQVPQMRILHEPARYAAAVYVRWRLQYQQVMPGMTTRDTAGLVTHLIYRLAAWQCGAVYMLNKAACPLAALGLCVAKGLSADSQPAS